MADDVGRLAARLDLDVVDFKTGMQTANRELRVLGSEFRATEASLGPLASGMEGLSAKSDNLTKRIAIQREKVAKLAKVYDDAKEAAKQKGDTTLQTQKAIEGLTIKVNNAKTVLSKMENELNSTSASMSELTNKAKITAEKMKDLSSNLKKVGESAERIGGTLTRNATLPIIATGGAAIKFASDVQESLGKTDLIFDYSSTKIKEWSKNTIDSFGLAQGTALDMASNYGDLATSMNIASATAAEMSISLTERAADIASLKNTRVDVADTAMTAIFTGETESLRKLGVVMTQANLQTYALSLGMTKNIQDMTEAEKVNLRYAYVMEKTSTAAGNFALTSDGAVNQTRALQERLKDATADLGQMLLPAYEAIITKVNDVVKSFRNLDDGTKKTILTAALIIAAVGPTILIFGKVVTAISAIVAVIPALVAGIQLINAGFLGLLANPVILAFVGLAAVIGLVGAAASKSSNKVKKMKQEIIAAADAVKEEKIQAIQEAYNFNMNKLDEELLAEKMASSEKMALLEEEHLAKKDMVVKEIAETRSSLQEQSKVLDASHNKEIARIREEYGVFEEKVKSKTDLVIEERDKQLAALDVELNLEKENYAAVIKLLEEEYGVYEEKTLSRIDLAKQVADVEIKEAQRAYDLKIKLLDEELKRNKRLVDRASTLVIGDLEDKLALIEGATEEEVALEKKKRLEKRIIELEDLIAAEKNSEARVALTQERQNLIEEVIQNSSDKQLEIQRFKVREEILSEKVKAAELKTEYDNANAEMIIAAQETLANETDAINEKTANEIAKIQEELASKIEAETLKFEETQNRINNEIEEITTKANAEITKIQEERMSKETAENAKYEATKISLENQLASLESYQTDYFAALEEELAEKKRIEEAKLASVEERIASEKALLDKGLEMDIDIVNRQNQAIKDSLAGVKDLVKAVDIDLSLVPEEFKDDARNTIENAKRTNPDVMVDMNKVITGELYAYDLQGKKMNSTLIEPDINNLQSLSLTEMYGVPAKAVGDNNWRGGLVQVHEKGGEIINLPRGSQIIPNDISKTIADSYGKAMATHQKAVSQVNNFYSPKALDEATIKKNLTSHSQRLQLMYNMS